MEARTLIALVLAAVTADACGRDPTPRQRLAPSDFAGIAPAPATPGTSGVAGIQTKVLNGNPAEAGLYTIMLTVPPNTRIAAHDHPDDRVATVLSGTWYFGYGKTFDERSLKALPPGSFYTEPPAHPHFARTGDTEVVLQITGMGPTGTTFVAE